MNTGRPIIKVELSTLEKTIEVVGIIAIVLLIGIPMYHYNLLPDEIPVHFNGKGEADSFGKKDMIWTLPFIGTLLFVGLKILTRKPHLFNYPTEITDENAAQQYSNMVRMLILLNTFFAGSFVYIIFRSIQMALGQSNGLGAGFILFFIGGVSAIVISGLISSNK